MSKFRRLQGGLRSKFEECEGLEAWRLNGEPLAEGETAPPMLLQIEMVYKGRKVKAIYMVANGERIAYRGREGGMPAWISMKEGCVIHNSIDAPGTDTVQ